MARVKILQELDGSHKFTVTNDGKEKTEFVKFKFEEGEEIASEDMPPGLAEKLIELGYATTID